MQLAEIANIISTSSLTRYCFPVYEISPGQEYEQLMLTLYCFPVCEVSPGQEYKQLILTFILFPSI